MSSSVHCYADIMSQKKKKLQNANLNNKKNLHKEYKSKSQMKKTVNPDNK